MRRWTSIGVPGAFFFFCDCLPGPAVGDTPGLVVSGRRSVGSARVCDMGRRESTRKPNPNLCASGAKRDSADGPTMQAGAASAESLMRRRARLTVRSRGQRWTINQNFSGARSVARASRGRQDTYTPPRQWQFRTPEKFPPAPPAGESWSEPVETHQTTSRPHTAKTIGNAS